MVKEFQEGEVYTNPKLERDVMVLGIGSENTESVTLAILWVDRDTHESCAGGELTIKKAEFADWNEVQY